MSSDEENIYLTRKCPKCGHAPMSVILYGMPNLSSEKLRRDIDAGKVSFGGCCVSPGAPKWRCDNCDQDFYKQGD